MIGSMCSELRTGPLRVLSSPRPESAARSSRLALEGSTVISARLSSGMNSSELAAAGHRETGQCIDAVLHFRRYYKSRAAPAQHCYEYLRRGGSGLQASIGASLGAASQAPVCIHTSIGAPAGTVDSVGLQRGEVT